ncbi:MAG TPA: tetratricopeptide repeat protein [Acidobacteriaceae bacterium]|nr:tetratricopeptide repeat protein [Acidobacteriaceae bacterium]
MKTSSYFCSFLLVSILTISANRAAGQLPDAAGGPTTNITRPDSIQDVGYGGFMASLNGSVIAGGGLSGKVVLQGNPLLWDPVKVVLSCEPGKDDLTADTDANGTYIIDHVNVGRAFSTEDDALSTQMIQHYEGCSLSAPLAGYHSTSVTITQKNLRDNPYMQNIVLTPDEHAPGTAFSTVGESDSPEARKAFDEAHDDWLHRNYAGAQQDLQQAVQLSPQFAEAWFMLGRLQLGSDQAAAEVSFKKAHAADPKYVPPCIMLAGLAMAKRNWPEASEWATTALTLDPGGTARLWYYDAQADYHLGKNEAARTSAQNALAMDPEHDVPNAEELLALTLADKGDYAEAAAHLKHSLNYITAGPSVDLIKRQLAYMEQQSAAKK